MKKLPLLFLLALLAPAAGATLVNEGILGNSGGSGKSLVRFGPPLPRINGIGVAVDSTGSLWDRGGAGLLNRYAVDGRLLASYPIPAKGTANDRIVRIGDRLILNLAGKLYSLPVDAAPGTAPTDLSVPADMISFGTAKGAIALGTQDAQKLWSFFLFDPATGAKTPLTAAPVLNVRDAELLPDGGLVLFIPAGTPGNNRGHGSRELYLYRDGQEVLDGWPRPRPGERLQFIGGYWYGGTWHGTLRRFNAALETDPGVVLGGGSGAFIGHVDGNIEVLSPRGIACVSPARGLWAVSGAGGVLQLLQWDEKKLQFAIVRRIGALPLCSGLALNRQGLVWYGGGYWNWSDGPDAPLHDCAGGPEEPDFGQPAVLPNDFLVVPVLRNAKPSLLGGPFSWDLYYSDLRASPPKALLGGTAFYADKNSLFILAVDAGGAGETYRVGLNGRVGTEVGPAQLEPATPVKEWTSLAAKDADTLLGAGDGFVVELVRDGPNWKETRRWNGAPGAAGNFGSRISICADAGRLWIADTDNHRVLCLGLADGRLIASFGKAGEAGDDAAHLNGPRTIAAREARAVVFDSGNQRIVKLSLSE